MITIEISPSVTWEQQQDPRFKDMLRDATRFFNSPHFAKKDRGLLVLHETGHLLYARRAGATNIKLHGPAIFWCSGCPGCSGNAPSISRSSVSWTFPAGCEKIAALKAHIGGIVFRQILSDTPNDDAAKWSDMKGAREWYRQNVGPDEAAFLRDVEVARQDIIDDLKSPAFQQQVWATAAEFEREVFLTPRPTAVLLWQDTRTNWSPLAT